METTGKVGKHRDVLFSASKHLRLLLRVERTAAIRNAIRRAIRPGSRVLDAGCGSGILSFLALQEGASHVMAVDRDHVDLASDIAGANSMASQIRFVQADLNDILPSASDETFDVIIAFIYTNHIVVDERRSQLVSRLRANFGSNACSTIPNRVRYAALAVEWTQWDPHSEMSDLRRAIGDIERRYGLHFSPMLNAVSPEVQFARARPSLKGHYDWMPGGGNGGYRYERNGMRVLSQSVPVVDIRYDEEELFRCYPDSLSLTVDSTGVMTGILWIQELLFDEFLIWTAESMSPVRLPVAVRPGQDIEIPLDERWRETNVLHCDV